MRATGGGTLVARVCGNMTRNVFAWGVRGLGLCVLLSATGCLGTAQDEVDEADLASSTEALSNDGVWMGNASGRVYTTSGGIDYEDIQSNHVFNAMRDSTWPTSSPKRYSIIDWADWENYNEDMSRYGVPGEGQCGDAARAHYGAEPGKKWCTEYARWVLRAGGLRNIRYCKTSFIGCVDYVYLSEASTVDDMVKLFTANGGWTNRANLTINSFQPGDYMAVMSHNLHKNHSAIIMAVSSDKRWVYTSEGNVTSSTGRDCVWYNRRNLYVNGVLDSEIDGVGSASVAF